MATIEQALYTRATGHTALAAIISTSFFPEVAQQDEVPPYVIYTKISSVERPRTYGKRAQIVFDRFQMDCYATTKEGVLALRDQVVDAFDCWSSASASPVVLDSKLVQDAAKVELIDTNTQLRRMRLDFEIAYRNPQYV